MGIGTSVPYWNPNKRKHGHDELDAAFGWFTNDAL